MHALCTYYSLLFTFLQYIAIKSAKVLFHLLLFVYLPSIQVKGKTHTPVGPTCGRIWHLVMTCCLCIIEMSETQATSFMNEYSMHNAMQNSRTGIEKSTDSKSSIDEIAFSM